MKLLCFLAIGSFLIIIQPSAFSATKTISNIDMGVILSGIQHYNSVIQSGEADMTHTMIQKAVPMTDKKPVMNETYKYHFMFDRNKMRMDTDQDQMKSEMKSDRFRHHTYIYFTGQWEWEMSEEYVNGKSSILYIYNTTVRSKFEQRDPRDYGEFDRDRFLNKNDFRVKGQEKIDNIVCYVLEHKNGKTRFWIAPEQGFRVLKTEYEYSLGPHYKGEDGKERYGIERNFISYEKHGEVWFPKAVDHRIYYIDKKGQKQLMVNYKTEAKNIRLNHQIPKEKFAIDLQHDADEIKVFLANSDEVLTKEQFIERYGSVIKSSNE
jgi:outer membrane lipoprotein-sorting protein